MHTGITYSVFLYRLLAVQHEGTWPHQQGGEPQERRSFSNVLKAPACWCVLVWVSCVYSSDVIRESRTAHSHVCVCVCASLWAKACLHLNNNGGSDPDRCFTAVTPSHSEAPPTATPSKAVRCCQREHGGPTLKRWDEQTHIRHAPRNKSMRTRNNSLLVWDIKINSIFQPETWLFLQITPKNHQWAEKRFNRTRGKQAAHSDEFR